MRREEVDDAAANGEELHPDSFNFRAGIRTYLDRQVLQIMRDRPSGIKESDYIKEALVIAYGPDRFGDHQGTESELDRRVSELENEFRNIIRNIKTGITETGFEQEQAAGSAGTGVNNEELKRLEELADQMDNAF